MKKIDSFSTEHNEDTKYTHNTSDNTRFITFPFEYKDISPKSICSNEFEYKFDNSIFRTSMCNDKLPFISDSSNKSNSEFGTHSSDDDSIHDHSYLSEKDLNSDQQGTSDSLEDSVDSMINISKGTIFCSNTSLDSTLIYSSTIEDSAIIANESYQELNNSTSIYENQSNSSNWINQNIYEYQQLKNESNYGILEENNENVRQSLLLLSPWEVEDENINLKCRVKKPSSKFQYSRNSVKEPRITESTPENPEFTLTKSNSCPIIINKEYKNTINVNDSDARKSSDITIDSGNLITHCKLHIFHKALKPLGSKSQKDNLDIGLYLILKQGGIDSNGAKSILLDPQIKTSIHYFTSEGDLDSSDRYLTQNNENLKKWYDLQVANLYQKSNTKSQNNQRLSVSGLAKFVNSVDWSRRESVKAALEVQKHWNPFSIFGSAPPCVNLPDIFDYNFYKNFAPLEVLKTNAVFKGLSNMEQINIDNGLNDYDWPMIRNYLETRWNNQASLDCDWRCDELEINEVFWYLNIMEKYKDKSNSVYTLEPCYCVTPDPQLGRGLMWNDPRCNPIYPRPSLYNLENFGKNNQEFDLGQTNSQSHQNREDMVDSLSLDDLPDTPEMSELENPDNCPIDTNLGNVYPINLTQIPMYPYRGHLYMDQSYQFQYQQYHSPFGTFTYPSQSMPVTHNDSTLSYSSVGIGKRRKGLHQYDYQPARVKHKLNMMRNN